VRSTAADALWKELVEPRSVAPNAPDRGKWLTISLGLGVPALILAAVIYFHAGGVFFGAGDPAKDDSSVTEAATPQPGDHSKPVGHDFAAGLGRLDQALDNFKGEKLD
jgi:hypothetical protein